MDALLGLGPHELFLSVRQRFRFQLPSWLHHFEHLNPHVVGKAGGGGEEDAFEKAKPALSAMGRPTLVGPAP